jgi:hypothetical protein
VYKCQIKRNARREENMGKVKVLEVRGPRLRAEVLESRYEPRPEACLVEMLVGINNGNGDDKTAPS